MLNTILVTGGAGFIGSCYVRQRLAANDSIVVNLDALTYAGNLDSLPAKHEHHHFVHGDIRDRELVSQLLRKHRPTAIVNFAAESHVDRSIDGPGAFVQTNVVGTFELLQSCLGYYRELSPADRDSFRFLHVSTDEVFGSLGETGAFVETTPYAPNSPYSASKAASDMFVRAYRETYGLPTLITNCSNNYGPYQFPEKLIPLIIQNALNEKPLPVYGNGQNVRDWLYVDDHCRAIHAVLQSGRVGETYNVGGNSEKKNIEVVELVCDLLDEMKPVDGLHRRDLITFVKDRPGHDQRYAIDFTKINTELGWSPSVTFDEGLRSTIAWYLENGSWVDRVTSGVYRQERLGLN